MLTPSPPPNSWGIRATLIVIFGVSSALIVGKLELLSFSEGELLVFVCLFFWVVYFPVRSVLIYMQSQPPGVERNTAGMTAVVFLLLFCLHLTFKFLLLRLFIAFISVITVMIKIF